MSKKHKKKKKIMNQPKMKKTVQVSESVQFYNEIGKIYIGCGICSLLILGFISLLPQDYEKYNIPLIFGIWILVSLIMIAIGIAPILLGKYSQKYQLWVEKEMRSFNKRQNERYAKQIEKDMKRKR